jgi:putative ABC transport system permease protein
MNITHYIKTASKSLLRNKLYSAMNIAGLAIGLGLAIIVLLVIKYELNYESSIKDSENIFRLTTIERSTDRAITINDAMTPMKLSSVISENKKTAAVTRLIPGADKRIKYNAESLDQTRLFFADTSFFDVFELNIVKGSLNKLNAPFTVVITSSVAEKYFGNTDPVGKSIRRGDIRYDIIAVCEDMPDASHLHFDFIASLASIEKMPGMNKQIFEKWENNWKLLTCYTYAKVKPGTDIRLLEESINKTLTRVKNYTLTGKENDPFTFHFQAIRSIHLHPKLNSEPEPGSNPFRIIIFIAIVIFILLITSINFINIITANPSKRLNDALIRKISGARRHQIALQTFTEAFLISGTATILGVILAELMLPTFNRIFGLQLDLHQTQGLSDIGYVILITFLIGIISGGYPAKLFSKINPVFIFSDRYKISKSSFVIRGMIIAGNVFVVLFLSVLTAGVWKQTSYITNADLGFNKNNLLIIRRAQTIRKHYTDFKEEAGGIKGVINITAATSVPGKDYIKNTYTHKGIEETQKLPIALNYVDCDYLQTLQLSLNKGTFLNCLTNDSLGIVLNSTAIKKFGINKPLEDHLETQVFNDKKWNLNIIGVVDDYNFEPLNNKVRPLGLIQLCRHNYFRYIIIRLNDRNNKHAITGIKTLWYKYSDNEPFDSFFLSDELNKSYSYDLKMLTALIIFTIFSFFISTLGFLSFASFLIEYKGEKISLLKTTGIPDIYILKDIIGSLGKYILIGSTLAVFPAILTIRIWLRNFEFIQTISFTTIILLIILVSATGIISISLQYYRLVSGNNSYHLNMKHFFGQK